MAKKKAPRARFGAPEQFTPASSEARPAPAWTLADLIADPPPTERAAVTVNPAEAIGAMYTYGSRAYATLDELASFLRAVNASSESEPLEGNLRARAEMWADHAQHFGELLADVLGDFRAWFAPAIEREDEIGEEG